MLKQLTKTLRLTALCGAALLAAAGGAHAAYVVINADPAFGPQLPNLGWRAVGSIFVPNDCLSSLPNNTNASVFRPQQSGACAGIRMQDVKVGFYDLTDPNAILEVLTIGTYGADLDPPPDQRDALTQKLTDIGFDQNDKVVDFRTSLSLPKLATHPLAGGGAKYFSLEFSSDLARLVVFGQQQSSYSDALFESSFRPTITISDYITDPNYVAPDFRVVNVATVPEPGTLALAGLALAGLGLSARRRRPVPA